ncbi:MAG: hypothetical protein ACYTDV_15440, partial [Planctomycetota bacterium]
APTINSVSASPDILWPASHKMVEVAVTVEAEDNSGHAPMGTIVAVESNEAQNGNGDGNTEPDCWEFTTDPLVVLLRAERAGGGDGRVYTITVACVDPSGNVSSEKTVEVTVPHDHDKGGTK